MVSRDRILYPCWNYNLAVVSKNTIRAIVVVGMAALETSLQIYVRGLRNCGHIRGCTAKRGEYTTFRQQRTIDSINGNSRTLSKYYFSRRVFE